MSRQVLRAVYSQVLCLGLALGQELRHRSRRPQPSARQASRAVGSLREPAELLARRPVDPRVADQGVCHQGPRQPTGRSCWRQGARPIRRFASIGPARGHCRGSSPPALHGHLQAEPDHVCRSSVILTSCQRTCGSAPRSTGKGPVPRPQTTGTRRFTIWQTTPTGIQCTTPKICFQAEQHSGRVGYTKHRFIDLHRPHLRPLLRKPQQSLGRGQRRGELLEHFWQAVADVF